VPKRKIVEVSRSQATTYLAKSMQFLQQAQSARRDSAFDAAMLEAIHAVIAAADAVCVALAGRRSADPDHQRAGDLLAEVAGHAAKSHLGEFRALLAKKNVVEYEARRTTAKEAEDAEKKAERFVSWAEGLVKQARPGSLLTSSS
jgi:hypothetical protein